MTGRLRAARSQLVLVDLQERLLPAIAQAEATLDRADILVRSAAELNVSITVTEQNPGRIGSTSPIIREMLPQSASIVEKITFDASADPTIAAHIGGLRDAGRDQLVIAGCEAHVCVLQTALGFRALGYEIFIAADAVSSRLPKSVSLGLERLRHGGCIVVNTEMVVFEWMERAGTDTFRRLLKLIK